MTQSEKVKPNSPKEVKKPVSFAAGWATWGLPVFASVFAPWQEKITAMSLISPWFQPTANIAASLCGPLTCFVAYAVLLGVSRKRRRTIALTSSVLFAVALLLCVVIKVTLERLVAPTDTWAVVAWISWFSIYLLVFVLFAVAIISAFLVTRPPAAK